MSSALRRSTSTSDREISPQKRSFSDSPASIASNSRSRPQSAQFSEEPIDTTMTTLGQGELSLASLGLTPESAKTEHQSLKTNPNTSGLAPGIVITKEPSMNTGMKPLSSVPTSFRRSSQPSISTSPKPSVNITEANEPSLPMSPLTPTVPEPGNNSSTDMKIAPAPAKRNADFHKLFRSLPENDVLIDDFSCALSREILIQGRLYVSTNNICFNSNILGWVTNLIISYNEIVHLERKSTAGLFPNGMVVQTLHSRHTFASFISRDTVFELIMNLWRKSNGRKNAADAAAAAVASGRTEDRNTANSTGESDNDDAHSSQDDDDDDDEEEEEEDSSDLSEGYETDDSEDLDSEIDASSADEFGDTVKEVQKGSKSTISTSANPKNAIDSSLPMSASEIPATTSASKGVLGWIVANLGPDVHSPTDQSFNGEVPGEKVLVDHTLNAPLGVVANLLFGESTDWISNFITEKEKNFDLSPMKSFPPDHVVGGQREYTYIKPLSGPIGPKQAKCICTDIIETWDMENKVVIVTNTSTPDVPSGGSFITKTRYSLFWTEGNQTRLVLSYYIDWIGRSFIKTPIERASQDGQMSFSKNLVSTLEHSLKQSKSSSSRSDKKSRKKTKKQSRSKSGSAAAQAERSSSFSSSVAQEPKPTSFAVLDVISDILVSRPIPSFPVPVWLLLVVGLMFVWMLKPSRTAVNFTLSSEELRLLKLQEDLRAWTWFGERGLASLKNSAVDRSSSLEAAIKMTERQLQELKNAIKH